MSNIYHLDSLNVADGLFIIIMLMFSALFVYAADFCILGHKHNNGDRLKDASPPGLIAEIAIWAIVIFYGVRIGSICLVIIPLMTYLNPHIHRGNYVEEFDLDVPRDSDRLTVHVFRRICIIFCIYLFLMFVWPGKDYYLVF